MTMIRILTPFAERKRLRTSMGWALSPRQKNVEYGEMVMAGQIVCHT